MSCREVYFLIAVGIPFGFQHEHVSLGSGLSKLFALSMPFDIHPSVFSQNIQTLGAGRHFFSSRNTHTLGKGVDCDKSRPSNTSQPFDLLSISVKYYGKKRCSNM
ncbi:unnamed protein product [Chondrus crispus]|uniref:Uncharacterized protein n=1 Tax=Chondrus crispus TaxID=2769 RepID=R7Q3S2_CHOCR|nr:unnamed protein product [Chondrus crispus]CDF32679.1 unnamed protein product [Chondrus crispus]|eukprot:XP_005712450.1 unnamed protein product [Chondrus crispus]